MDPDFIDMIDGYVWFGGLAVPITCYFDDEGEECEPGEAEAIVYGPLPGDGIWGSLALSDVEWEAPH